MPCHPETANAGQDDDRREFLKTCGKFAVVTPPTLTLLLSTSLTSDAIAQSGAGAVHHGNMAGAMAAATAARMGRTTEVVEAQVVRRRALADWAG